MHGSYRWIMLTLASVLFVHVMPAVQSDVGQVLPSKNWPLVHGNWTNERYSTLSQININTVKNLGGAWVKKLQEGDSTRSAPVVEDGVMYITAGPRVYAINAKTGATLWTWKSKADEKSMSLGTSASELADVRPYFPTFEGVAVAEGRVFVGLTRGRVVALDKRTGQLVWSQQIGTHPPQKGETVTSALTYANGTLFTGLANGDWALRGRVVALDAKTGHIIWSHFDVPGPGEPGHETWPQNNDVWKIGGGGAWQPGAVDPKLGLVYFVNGNPIPPFGGEVRGGKNLFTCCVLAFDMKTGKLRWYYQLIHHDLWEADLATAPVLCNLQVHGKSREALAVMRADGYLFLLDARTGKPIIPIEERPVPQDARMKTYPTQPFPVGADRVLPGYNAWEKEKIPSGFKLGHFFSPVYNDQLNVLRPFFGMRVVPMSFSPQTGYFYATGIAFLGWRRRTRDPYMLLNLGDSAPGMTSYGITAAIDSRTDKIVWEKSHLPSRGGGAMTTAGGLMFESEADGKFKAYDAKTGKILWEFQIGTPNVGLSAVLGPSTTYEVDGEQYIAVPARSSLWAFKLGGRVQPLPEPKQYPTSDTFTGPIIDTNEIQTTSLDQDSRQPVGGTRWYIDEYRFDPYRARVKVGTRVTWVNNGDLVHTIVALDGSWTTGPISPAQAGHVTFDKPGKYTYICKNHPWVYGELIVAARGVQSGLYNEDQANRGRIEYLQSCSSCHTESLGGDGEAIPSLAGPSFMLQWEGHAVADLFDRTRTTMPQKKPGSLSNQTYLDIIAFLLQSNDFPAGKQELKDTPRSLKSVMTLK